VASAVWLVVVITVALAAGDMAWSVGACGLAAAAFGAVLGDDQSSGD
jgi:hypothetical protein